MGELLSENKPALLKVLTGLATGLCLWLNKKFQIELDPTAIAAIGISIIAGMALHGAARDHGRSAAEAEGGPKPPVSGGAGGSIVPLLLLALLPLFASGCAGVRLDEKVMRDYKAAHDVVLPEYEAWLDGKAPTLSDAQKGDRRAIVRKLREIDEKGVR